MSTNAILAALLMQVETGNRPIVGDNGRAIGPLQVHAGAVQDVNRAFGTSYKHRDMMDRAAATAVLDRYLWIYAQPKRLGRPVTDSDRARIWNGGPDGWRRAATLAYAERVRRASR
mgnify:CR=1 FL=1